MVYIHFLFAFLALKKGVTRWTRQKGLQIKLPSDVIIASLRLFVFVSVRSDKMQQQSQVITPQSNYIGLLLTASA